MIIGITGAYGFLGWHLRSYFHTHTDDEILLAGRDTFESADALDVFVSQCDVIIHAAGVNRSADADEIYSVNVGLADALVESLGRVAKAPGLIFTNSTHVDGETQFGIAKREAADKLGAAFGDTGGFADVVFPHLFGEYGQPFYNSAVHTFAHQIVEGSPPEIHNDSELNLMHAQDAARIMHQLAVDLTGAAGSAQHRPQGEKVMVSAALERLRTLADPYLARGDIPTVDNRLDLKLFNLVRSNMYPKHYPINMTVHGDDRGGFYEVLRAHGQGQTSISTTVPGITRGEHYHLDKIERFVVVSGEATISMRQLFTSEVTTYEVSGREPVAIDMPPLTTHNIINVGSSELVTLFWSNDHFDPAVPDTYGEAVVVEGATETVRSSAGAAA